MDESEISDAVQTIETLQAIAEDQVDFNEVEDFDDDEFVQAKCLCVHGECAYGDSECSRCYTGWTGRLCDIPSDIKQGQRGMNPGLIEDDEDDDIFNPRKIRDSDQTYQAPNGRRRGDRSDRSGEYKPRQGYN